MLQFCRVGFLIWILYSVPLLSALQEPNVFQPSGTNGRNKDKPRNDRPIFGIMAQERKDEVDISFIAVPYVKHIEASGARLSVILIEQDEDYYRRVVEETNGLIIPGGNRNITGSHFQRAAQLLFKFAQEANDRGELYPIYGVCQGLQIVTLMILEHWEKVPDPYWLTKCVAEDISVNLKFQTPPNETRIFHDASESILNTLTTENATPNYHRKCFTPTNVTASGLYKHMRIVTTSFDKHGLEFVSTFESLNASRPIYLLQWHPEKVLIEFKIVPGAQVTLKHTPSAMLMAQYMGNFIVGEARKNLNNYPSLDAENQASIFNCNPIFTMGKSESDVIEREHFTQIYHFNSETGCTIDTEPLFIHYIIAIVALASVIVILLGVFIAQFIMKKKSYTQLGAENI